MSSETRLLLLGIALATFAGLSFRLVDERDPVSPAAKPADKRDVVGRDAGAEPDAVRSVQTNW